MTKRLIPTLLLAASCLLAGCSGEAQSVVSTPEAAPTPSPTPIATPTPTPEPTVVFEVQTDYSQYTPHEKESIEPIYTRLSEDWISDLAPGDDYGALYPFTASISHGEYGDGSVYGIADESGRIVCDGVYCRVERLSCFDYFDYTSTYIPMLRLTKNDRGDTLYAVASTDGSFVTDCVYGYVRAIYGGVVCGNEFGSTDFVIYDYEGNVLLRGTDLRLGILCEPAVYYCSEGRLIINAVDSEGEGGYYVLDMSGNMLHGPYMQISAYENGRAIAQDRDSKLWGVVNLCGNWVIAPEYESINHGCDGAYICFAQQGGCMVLDPSGREILFADTAIYKTGVGYHVYNRSTHYWPDGSLMSLPEGDWQAAALDGRLLYQSATPGKTILLDPTTGKTLELPGRFTVMALMLPSNSAMAVGSSLPWLLCCADDWTTVPYVVSADLETVIELTDSPGTGMGGASIWMDGLTGEEYIRVYDSSYNSSLYSADMELLAENIGFVRLWNGKFIETDDTHCTISDMKGNVLFRYPLVLPDWD